MVNQHIQGKLWVWFFWFGKAWSFLAKPNKSHMLVQVKWFTDGAQFNTDHEMIIWLWSSTTAMKNWCTKIPFATIPMRFLPTKELRRKANKVITEAIAWDSILVFTTCLNLDPPSKYQKVVPRKFPWCHPSAILGKSLLEGKFPSVDQFGHLLRGARAAKAGELICGGWRAGFESWTGDWKERSLSHSFIKRNYQSTRVCDQCSAIAPHARTAANLLHLVYSNFGAHAPWRQTIRSHQQYLQETPVAEQTPWLAVPGFTIERVRWDTAHTVLLGTGKDISASFLWDLVAWLELPLFFVTFSLFGQWTCRIHLFKINPLHMAPNRNISYDGLHPQ